MSPWISELQDLFVISPWTYTNLALSILIVLGLWLIRRWVLGLVFRNLTDVRVRYQWQKTTTDIYWVVVILALGEVWLSNIANLSTYLGLLSAGLAIALRDPVTNLIGWAFILWRRPFEVGDRIQIGTWSGDVIDLRIFQFTLMEIGNWVDANQSTGRVIHFPNGKIFTEALANYSKGFQFIWEEILVTFSQHADIDFAYPT